MASNSDMKNEMKTYESFISFFKWGTIISFGIAALVVFLIA
ncbi:MAG: aa3-type cytochrome c oxidase subunit IV [Alphaproteobacteria bacterium]|nr:aa3-type cytochrome c oxidase subunit IV [Alphaproteobacteria bacterium]